MAHAGVSPNGVYVVYLDADIVGPDDPVVWCFVDEVDAQAVSLLLQGEYGAGRSWYSFEPLARSLDEPDLLEYLRSRLGVRGMELARRLKAAASAQDGP